MMPFNKISTFKEIIDSIILEDDIKYINSFTIDIYSFHQAIFLIYQNDILVRAISREEAYKLKELIDLKKRILTLRKIIL